MESLSHCNHIFKLNRVKNIEKKEMKEKNENTTVARSRSQKKLEKKSIIFSIISMTEIRTSSDRNLSITSYVVDKTKHQRTIYLTKIPTTRLAIIGPIKVERPNDCKI